MASENIIVYIDPTQLTAQKGNHYSLFLAKMVNGQFTVIWQSKGPVATVGNPSYEYMNTFQIAVPNYEVNYGTVTVSQGSVTFNASGLPQTMSVGQSVQLDANGLFGQPTNTGTPGEITIVNALAANPNAILLDNAGNPIFVNTQSGMDIGTATLTPVDTYQIWFDNYQNTGTIIAHNVSNAATVTFAGGSMSQTISYNSAGQWVTGPLSTSADFASVGSAGAVGDPVTVTVLATFSVALTTAAATYLLSKLINKFSGGLRPTSIQTSVGSVSLTIKFQGSQARQVLAAFGTDKFENAVNAALVLAKQDTTSGLQSESWSLSEPSVALSF
ncbi:MAG: hypothetical protein JWP49_1070 [Phenylobacterium sp.]|jgi:hypothetical protein|nr:hypothetical protein [Phenylobacterium sp.]